MLRLALLPSLPSRTCQIRNKAARPAPSLSGNLVQVWKAFGAISHAQVQTNGQKRHRSVGHGARRGTLFANFDACAEENVHQHTHDTEPQRVRCLSNSYSS
ncbi:hypothetical protein HGRIS_002077 [Hohenbuehelia grisea]|uniref:Secreted protein n=1 Tax=Hohenbuehelia grisea TaxID=104357 RepID=A0ABR3JJE1_9AGAR